MKSPDLMIPAVVESPYAPSDGRTVEDHIEYLDECLAWCIKNGFSPYASHGLLTRALRDEIDSERQLGIKVGYVFHDALGLVIFFEDYGFSEGMKQALDRCVQMGTETKFVSIRKERTTCPNPHRL